MSYICYSNRSFLILMYFTINIKVKLIEMFYFQVNTKQKCKRNKFKKKKSSFNWVLLPLEIIVGISVLNPGIRFNPNQWLYNINDECVLYYIGQ